MTYEKSISLKNIIQYSPFLQPVYTPALLRLYENTKPSIKTQELSKNWNLGIPPGIN